MQDPDFISLFVAPLERAGIRYMITGSVASSIYGEPRNTLDIDLVDLLEKNHFILMTQLFPENEFYLPPSDVIAIETKREAHGHFNIIHHTTGFKADIYLSRNHPYFVWALANARRVFWSSGEITIAPPEYVILHKLDFYRESGHPRHLRDIAGILEQQNLDHELIARAVKELGLTKQWLDVSSMEGR
jgi:hypothetical protein